MMRLLGRLVWLSVLVVLALGAAVLWLLEPAPRAAGGGPPGPEDVAATRAFVVAVRGEASAAEAGRPGGVVALSEAEANGILRVAARIFPAGVAEVRVGEGRVHGLASLPVPWPGGRRWLNLEGEAPPFEGRPRLDRFAVGGVELPPALAVELGRVGANLVLGGRAGDVFLGAAERMEIAGDEMRFVIALGEAEKKGFMAGLFGAMRGSDMPGPEAVDAYYTALRDAIDAGLLPDRGSYLPHLRFVLARVHERATDETLADEYTAGIFGLSKACGATDFVLVVGRFVGDPLDAFGDWRRDCSEVTFAERIDARRHFTTAAAIRAASNRGVSVSIGEFKELHDSVGWERGGFDFSDIGANQSGIRLSDLVMSGTRDDLARTLAMIEEEDDVLVDLARLPQIMLRGEFEARYGSIESAAYAAELDRIERLIDEVPIHRAR